MQLAKKFSKILKISVTHFAQYMVELIDIYFNHQESKIDSIYIFDS